MPPWLPPTTTRRFSTRCPAHAQGLATLPNRIRNQIPWANFAPPAATQPRGTSPRQQIVPKPYQSTSDAKIVLDDPNTSEAIHYYPADINVKHFAGSRTRNSHQCAGRSSQSFRSFPRPRKKSDSRPICYCNAIALTINWAAWKDTLQIDSANVGEHAAAPTFALAHLLSSSYLW